MGQHKIAKNALFLDNLRIITKEDNIETRQMTIFFSSTIYALTIVTFIFAIDSSQNSFSLLSCLLSILVCKISQFWTKATDLDIPSYFSRK